MALTQVPPPPYLSSEENELATFLIKCSKIGYDKTKEEILLIVKKTPKKKGRDINFSGEGWWTNFIRRNPRLTEINRLALQGSSQCIDRG